MAIVWGPEEITATAPQYVRFEYSGRYAGLGGGDSGVTARICDYSVGVRDHSAAATAYDASYSGTYDFKPGTHKVTIEIFNGRSLEVHGKLYVAGSAAPTLAASTFTAADINFGETSTVSLANANISSVKHNVTWKVGNKSYSVDVPQGSKSTSYKITKTSDWMSQVASATSGTLTITVKTLKPDGTQIGQTASKDYKIYVPTDVVPSIGSLSPSIYNAVSGFNMYIQKVTGAQITIKNPAAGTGATIRGYSLSPSKTESYAYNNLVYTINKLSNSGSIKFTVTITDSRGRTASKDVTINVTAYSKPSISQTVAYRCDSKNNESETGTFARVMCVASKTNISGNTLYISTKYYKETSPATKYTGASSMASGSYYRIGGDIDANSTYIVQYTVYDTISGSGNAVTATARVGSTPYSIHVRNGGDGVAFGKVSERKGVEINSDWTLYYKGKALEQVIMEIARVVMHGGTINL